MLKICAYVPSNLRGRLAEKQEKGTLGNYFAGLRVIADSLERAGYSVEWADSESVDRYHIVLVSITSDRDWLNFVSERLLWPKGNYTTIIGGPGVSSVRPFLTFADIFVLGRGENLILDIVRAIESGERAIDEAIIYSDSFSMDTIYRFRQEGAYAHPIKLDRGFFYEGDIGCPYKCKFCAYSHHRKHIGGSTFETGGRTFRAAYQSGSREWAMLDILRGGAECYNLRALQITALDGLSERLRTLAGKPIRSDDFRQFLSLAISYGGNSHFKLYNIVGYPSESFADYSEFLEDVRYADESADSQNHPRIELHSTPFRAMPATPAACWPMSLQDYRGQISKTMQQISGAPDMGKLGIYEGRHLSVYESKYTESLPTTAFAAIVYRGVQSDSDRIARLALKLDAYERLNSAKKLDVLASGFDLDTLFGAFTAETLPTRNIRTYLPVEKHWP